MLITISLAILSFVELAYNEITREIDYQKIIIILIPTLEIVIVLFIFYIIVKFLIFSKIKSNTLIIEDLTYIYFNYNHYRNKFYN